MHTLSFSTFFEVGFLLVLSLDVICPDFDGDASSCKTNQCFFDCNENVCISRELFNPSHCFECSTLDYCVSGGCHWSKSYNNCTSVQADAINKTCSVANLECEARESGCVTYRCEELGGKNCCASGNGCGSCALDGWVLFLIIGFPIIGTLVLTAVLYFLCRACREETAAPPPQRTTIPETRPQAIFEEDPETDALVLSSGPPAWSYPSGAVPPLQDPAGGGGQQQTSTLSRGPPSGPPWSYHSGAVPPLQDPAGGGGQQQTSALSSGPPSGPPWSLPSETFPPPPPQQQAVVYPPADPEPDPNPEDGGFAPTPLQKDVN